MSYARMAATNLAQNAKPMTSAAAAASTSDSVQITESNSSPTTAKTDAESKTESTNEDTLVEAFRTVALTPSLIVNGSGTASSESTGIFGNGSPQEMFGRADSMSDLGTKPPSLDGKSITSGTTFALDEKESLRPDDSASVKAAEDDDTFSGRGSIVAGSRIGSEAAGMDQDPFSNGRVEEQFANNDNSSRISLPGLRNLRAQDDDCRLRDPTRRIHHTTEWLFRPKPCWRTACRKADKRRSASSRRQLQHFL